MSFDDFYKRFVACGLAFALSLYAAGFWYGLDFSDIFKRKPAPAPIMAASKLNGMVRSNDGGGAVSGRRFKGEGETVKKNAQIPIGPIKGVKILTKPRADYTPEARANNVHGKVVLRVTFSATGQIGAISVINGLPDGLTERAIEAAKGIKFEPATRGGVAYAVTKPVEYTFAIY